MTQNQLRKNIIYNIDTGSCMSFLVRGVLNEPDCDVPAMDIEVGVQQMVQDGLLTRKGTEDWYTVSKTGWVVWQQLLKETK